jgi:hypothetical protein
VKEEGKEGARGGRMGMRGLTQDGWSDGGREMESSLQQRTEKTASRFRHLFSIIIMAETPLWNCKGPYSFFRQEDKSHAEKPREQFPISPHLFSRATPSLPFPLLRSP